MIAFCFNFVRCQRHFSFSRLCIYVSFIIYHHHHIMLAARISLTLSRHSSLSFIAPGRSSGQHPISSHSCWMYVRAGRPAFARPCVGVHKSASLTSSAFERFESARDNFGILINSFKAKTKTLVRKLENDPNKIKQSVFFLFNQICLNDELQPNYAYPYIRV